MMSAAKLEIIHLEVAYHLDQLCRDFTAGRFQEDDIYNVDETNVVINLFSNNTLYFRGYTEVKLPMFSVAVRE